MELEILKFILSNQGSVDTEELLCSLCDSSLLTDILCKNDKFVPCLVAGRPRVVVQSQMSLCWVQDCPGCGRLHLCLRFLFSGSCQFTQLRRRCHFSHDLKSEYNLEVLRQFGLEMLTRTELCLLLLQSNNTLLPPICFNYNWNGSCQDECPGLHICERYFSRDCSCPRTHDFSAPQPLKLLQDKHIPEHLFKFLKSVYANKRALRLAKKGKAASSDRDAQNAGCDSDSSTNSKQSSGRGRRGGRGRGGRGGGYRGNRRHDGTLSEGNDDSQDTERAEETLHDDYDSDSSSVSTGFSKDMRGGYGPGQGGLRGNRRGKGNRQAASNVDGTNASQGRSRGHRGNYRGNFREGRGGRGNRGSGASKADGTLFSRDLQEAENPDNTEVEKSQHATQSVTETGSSSRSNRNSSQKGRGTREEKHISGSDKPSGHTSPARNVSTADASGSQHQRSPKDKTDICMFFIKGHCKYGDDCSKAHDKMPYRWEIKQDGQWTLMADSEKIEKDYCNPENTYSTTSPPVHFDMMKCGTDEVRRLSTVNSVQEPHFIHTTKWLWYWEDEYGKWYQYAAITSEHRLSSITSRELEERYLINNKDVVLFTAGSQSYELSFQDMLQTNLRYSTKRLVRRRPRFVSPAEVQTRRKPPTLSSAVPDYWDKTHIPSVGFKTVTLQPSSGEYKEIQDLFHQTMAGFEILKIERIKNKTVWEAFQLCKTHMKIKNGGQPVLEKKLFHGTDPKHVDTICQTNFDWRVCGVNATVYGQGSYFARDAKFSHNYTGDSDPRFMFVSRVLVGEFTKGSPEYRRPPSKDGGDVNLFDSCVNNVANPSIFVVFKEQQIYPEYLLQYRHE